jgi:hypothetical protein
MAEKNEYKVVWEIGDVIATTPLQAAKTAQDWLRKDNWQYYIQDVKTKEIFSVDLDEEDEDAVLPITGEYLPEIMPKLNKKKTYYLFGIDACHLYSEESFESLLNKIENDGLDFGLFTFTEGETPSIDLLYAANRWNEYSTITEEEFDKLNNFI